MSPAIQQTGAWIFLSHSHKDLGKVRKIRDELESRGHNPLIFYLKCLEDDSAELPDLLRREIEARHWFILCDSPNARASKWVQEEMAMIEAMEDRTFEIIDLNKDLESQLLKINNLTKHATVLLSYSRSDAAIAQQISDYLAKADFSVWTPSFVLRPHEHWRDKVQSTIDDAVQWGFVLVLLSRRSVTSPYCRDEIEYALASAHRSERSTVIPVIIDDQFDFCDLPQDLHDIYAFNLTAGWSFEEQMDDLIRSLRTLHFQSLL